MNWTQKHLEQLKAAGKIRDYSFSIVKKQPKPSIGGRIVMRHYPKKSKEKNHIEITLLQWCQKRGKVLYEEYKFNPQRKWRFDWCIPELKIAIEYEGIFSEKSGHTSLTGYSKDTEKYNSALTLGWKVYRYTAATYQNLINEIK